MEDISSLAVDNRGYVSDEDRDRVFKKLLSQSENAVCIDCNARNPTWISLTFAIHLCLNCSGRHRQFGSHISFVRSIDMDKFTREQLIRISCGGNARCKKFLKSYGLYRQPVDYAAQLAQKYPAMLDEELQNPQGQLQRGSSFDLLDLNEDAKPCKSEDEVSTVTDSKLLNYTPQASTTNSIQQMGMSPRAQQNNRGSVVNFRGQTSPRGGFSGRVNVDFDAFEKSIRSGMSSKKSSISSHTSIKEFESCSATPVMSLSPRDDGALSPRFPSSGYESPALAQSVSNFAGKSSVSSDEMFGRGIYSNVGSSHVTLDPNKTSLSSDEYFGRSSRNKQRSSSNTFEERAVQNIKEGIATAIKEGNKLMGMARQWLNEHQF